jgi:uncharacterized membrane protein
MTVTVNPLDLKTILLAKHAQHVALVHFPIALFISAVALDAGGYWTNRHGWLQAAYYNFTLAAISVLPVLVTGILAWQFALEGERLKGVLLFHLTLGALSSIIVSVSWWIHFRARRRSVLPPGYRFAVEFTGALVLALAGHLGGFLSGVNQ